MKKIKLVNIVLIMIVCFAILLTAKESFAANGNIIDLTNTITPSNNNNNNTASDGGSSTTTSNGGSSTSTSNGGSSTSGVPTNNTVLTTSNTSNYNNTTLPKTGVEDSIPGIILIVVLGISAVYAYNRIQYYKDI